MHPGLAVAAAAACAALLATAESIRWTGYGGDNQWTNRINWSPDKVPTLSDDVTIAAGTVEVTIDTGANSILMGTSFDKPANLIVFKSFFVGSGGLNVDGNGNVTINSGAASVTGRVEVDGGVSFRSGAVSGQWTIRERGVADLGGPAQKVLTGCQMSVAGALRLSGVLVLNKTSKVTVAAAATLSGDVSVQAQDDTRVLFDASAGKVTYTGGGNFQIQAPMKLGAFDFEGGNMTLYDGITFAGKLTVPTGSYVASVGTAVVDLSPGLGGTGVVTASGTSMTVGASRFDGVLNVAAGNVTLAKGAAVATATVGGGRLNAAGAVTVTALRLAAGSLGGSVTAAAVQLQSPGFGLDGALTVSGRMSTSGTSLLAYGAGGALVVSSNATLVAGGPLTLTGASGHSLRNDGTLVASSRTTLQNIDLMGRGSASVTAALAVSTASVSQATVRLAGAGVLSGSVTRIGTIGSVAAKPSVDAVIGAYHFTCPGQCTSVRTDGTPTADFAFSVGSS